MIYAGIGSRNTPEEILEKMERLSISFDKRGWILRSGNARGADQAFMVGSKHAEIYIPKEPSIPSSSKQFEFHWFEDKMLKKALKIASKYHPAWERCSPIAKLLHARNVGIICGKRLKKADAVDIVLYYAKEDSRGIATGGTGLAVRIAKDLGIPHYNMLHYKPKKIHKIFKKIECKKPKGNVK